MYTYHIYKYRLADFLELRQVAVQVAFHQVIQTCLFSRPDAAANNVCTTLNHITCLVTFGFLAFTTVLVYREFVVLWGGYD